MSCGPTTTTSSTAPPAQFMNAYTNVVNRAGEVANQPLQQMAQPVAGFNQTQQNAFNNVNNAQGLATPFLNSASDMVGLGTRPLADQTPLMSDDASRALAASGVNTVTTPSRNYFTSALQALPMLLAMMGGGGAAYAGQPGLAAAPPAGYSSSYDVRNGATSTPNIGPVSTSTGAIPDSTRGLVPDVNSSTINSFMSPYTQNVVDATQAQFNHQNAMQREALKGNAISAGAFGGDRAGVAEAELANSQGLSQNPVIAGLYNQGYAQALAAAQSQQQAGLQKAGLGVQQENVGLGQGQLSLSQQQANIDAQLRQRQMEGTLGLGQQQQDLASQLGLGNLSVAQQQQLLQGLGLGINAFQAQDQSDLARAGTAFNAYGQNVSTALQAAQGTGALNLQGASTLGNLGLSGQDAALSAANAQLGTGSLEQQLEQQQLNVPYNLFQQAQQYPFYTSNFLAAITANLGSLAGGTSRQTQPAPSPLSQVAGVGMAALPFFAADGGRIERDAGGGIGGYGVLPTSHGSGPPSAPTVSTDSSMDPLAMLMKAAPYLSDMYKDGSFGGLHKLFDKKTPSLGGVGDYGYDMATAAEGGRVTEATVLRAPSSAPVVAMPHFSAPSQSVPVTSGTPGSSSFNPGASPGQITTVPNKFPPIGTTLGNGSLGPVVPDWPNGYEPTTLAQAIPGLADFQATHGGFGGPPEQFTGVPWAPDDTEASYLAKIGGGFGGASPITAAPVTAASTKTKATKSKAVSTRGTPGIGGGFAFGGSPGGFTDFNVPNLPDLPGYLPFDVNQEMAAHHESTLPAIPQVKQEPGLGQAALDAPKADGEEDSIFGKGKNQDWRMASLAAGLGMLSGTSPNAGVNIGRGGLMGIKALADSRTEKEAKRKELKQEGFEQQRVDIAKESAANAAKRLDADLSHWQEDFRLKTTEHEDTVSHQKALEEDQRLDRERQTAADKSLDRYRQSEAADRKQNNESEAAYRERMSKAAEQNADAGRWTYVGTDDETGKAIFVDGRTGEEKLSDKKIKPKAGAAGSEGGVTKWKHDTWLLSHPGDEQGALDYAAGRRSLGGSEIMKGAYSQARAEASANPGTLPDSKAIDARAAEIARAIQAASKSAAPSTIPVRPTNLPAGSQYSPSRKMWRDPAGKTYDEQGNPSG